MKPKKPKIKPGRGWILRSRFSGEIIRFEDSQHKVCVWPSQECVAAVYLPLADYRALVKNQRKVK